MRAVLLALSTALAAQAAAHGGCLNKQGWFYPLARNHTITTDRKKRPPVYTQIRQY